jgi:KipI family sensor histidine kinase inhibitor
MTSYPRALACGDCGISIEFGDEISTSLNDRVLALDRALTDAMPDGLIETVPTYRSLMIHYDPVVADFEALRDQALGLASKLSASALAGRLIEIPVCYEGQYGADLAFVAERLGLDVGEVVQRHTAPEYRVYMLGFQPGFAYLGGLDPSLSLPRHVKPRFGAPAGTISIAAGQCALHSVDGPSGWHWLGCTPIRAIATGTGAHVAIEPGDRIKFRAVTERAFGQLSRAALAGENIVGTNR